MAGRTPPKLSGLISTGAIVPATQDSLGHLPSFGSHQPPEPAAARHRDLGPALVTGAPSQPSLQGVMIPITKLKIHPFNSRHYRTQQRIEEVRDLLVSAGTLRDPLTVVPCRDNDGAGHYYILSGQTRYHAANLAGWTDLRCQINTDIDPSNHLEFWKASLEHNTSLPETDWDIALRSKQLLDEGHQLSQIYTASRRGERSTRRILRMIDAPSSIQELIKANPDKLSAHFVELILDALKHLDEKTIISLAEQVIAENMAKRELAETIDRMVKIQERDGTPRSRSKVNFVLPIRAGDQTNGALKVMNSKTTEGNSVLELRVDLPNAIIDKLKSDVVAAIEKMTGHQKGEGK